MKFLRSLVALLGCFLAFAARGGDSITYEPKPGPGVGKHVVFLSGDEEYRSEEGLPMLAKILSQRHGFKCTVLFALNPDGTINPDRGDRVGDAQALDSADAIVMLLRFRHWPDDAMKHFMDAVQRGVPIIGLRTSTHPFLFPRNSPSPYKKYSDKGSESFGRKVFGQDWLAHWGDNHQGATRGVIEPSSKDDPILRGVGDIFGDTGVYEVYPTEAKILVRGIVLQGMNPTDPPAENMKRRNADGQTQPVNDPPMPVVWSRVSTNDSGKITKALCTTMGSATDLRSEGLRRIVVNAVYWGLGLEVPAKADVAYVDGYKPTPYGPKRYRRGLTPADHALGVVLPESRTAVPAPPAPKAP